MTLHETAYERNETRNPTSFFVFFFRCNEEKHETHRDAFSAVVVLIISSNNGAFLSLALSPERVIISRLIYSFSLLCGDAQKNKRKMPKRTARWWTHERMDFDFLIDERCVLVLLCRRPISRQKKERSEAKFKKFQKNQTPLGKETLLVKISLCKTTVTRAHKTTTRTQRRRD